MDDIKQRLTDATEACLKTLDIWRAKPDPATRESLQEAVHELRKVGARLEIELAVSDRKSHGNEPIPIPSHRASRRQGPEGETMADDEGNRHGGGQNRGQQQGGRDDRQGGRGDRQGGGRPVQIRQREEGGAPASSPSGNDSASTDANADAGERKGKPLSLRRSGGDAE